MVLPVGASYLALRGLVQDEKAFAFALCLGVFYVLISREWSKRSSIRFWLIIAVFALVNVIGISLIKFPHYHGPSLIALPCVVADGFAMWGILTMLDRRIPFEDYRDSG
jgi:phosphoglycerol transferase MdoB-like AlkP superfamily enzyme